MIPVCDHEECPKTLCLYTADVNRPKRMSDADKALYLIGIINFNERGRISKALARLCDWPLDRANAAVAECHLNGWIEPI